MGDYSMEFCGGTHLENTAQAGLFKILSEAGVAAGTRRIEAITGASVMEYLNSREALIAKTADIIKSKVNEIDMRAEKLMAELKAVKGAVHPHEILLVVDSMTGQDAVTVANGFNDALGIDGLVLTKLDGDTRGGAALSARAVTGKPIKFVGIGEKLDDLDVFHPDRMASRILGMGDMLSLIERAEQAIDEKKARELEEKLRKNKFDMNDLLDQFEQVQKMGSIKDVLGMVPGINKQIKDVDIDERQFDRIRAIILSMTPKERENPDIINPSRKRRIAAGCGMQVEDVNRLLAQFKQMQKMFKQFGGKGGKRLSKSFKKKKRR